MTVGILNESARQVGKDKSISEYFNICNMSDDSKLVPWSCTISKWPDFNGYGFNLHAERGKVGQYIGIVDDDSPAQAAGLKEGDRIVEVKAVNIGNENHSQVVLRIKVGGEVVSLLLMQRWMNITERKR